MLEVTIYKFDGINLSFLKYKSMQNLWNKNVNNP